jgi:hypothetical protein
MKVHYHGSPMWGNVDIGEGKKIWCGDVLYRDSCALVSYAHSRYKQIDKILPICKSMVIDCGAFTFYQRGEKVDDSFWGGYYQYVLKYIGLIDWFVIPDVIGGSEEENDLMIDKVPSSLKHKGVPVWHTNESLDRLERLCLSFERVAIGAIREHKPVATNKDGNEVLTSAFDYIYRKKKIDVKIHGLAMLDGRILGKLPFDSADSAFVATNVPKTKLQMTEVQCKLARTAIYKSKIECVIPPTVSEWI